ncbi:MAG: hypothetical protein GF404_12500 [candidate division Zixibacteria bacterium]|nr:hypothetical protein [candidate division Zixibacteria bacterium]
MIKATFTAFLIFLLTLMTDLPAQVVVNEFLADPDDPLESEWIELYNASDIAVDIYGWKVCDLVACVDLPDVVIENDQYLVICQDELSFRSYYPDFDGELYQLESWRQLNNGGDQILLIDFSEQTVDSVTYQAGNDSNISWERIDPIDAGYDSTNWHASLDSTGSTPGMINSVVYGFSSDFDISLRNKVFSPGCGCPDDRLEFTVELPRECELTLTVFDLDGREVMKIYDSRSLTSGEYSYDGRDTYGNYLAVGMYILLAEVEGYCSGSKKLVFGVAKR